MSAGEQLKADRARLSELAGSEGSEANMAAYDELRFDLGECDTEFMDRLASFWEVPPLDDDEVRRFITALVAESGR